MRGGKARLPDYNNPMSPKKKPVDRTPIYNPAYVRQIESVWTFGRVPRHFWEDAAHRREYLLWLGGQLRFRCMEDWYRLSAKDMKGNRGSTPLRYWGFSAIAALKDCFPRYDWQEWLFTEVSDGFWDLRPNRRSYMAWLGRRLGYRRPDDWYAVTAHDFLRNRGRGVVSRHHGSPVQAVIDLIPGKRWCEWNFGQVPEGFWEHAENRHRYLRWLGKELGFRRQKDWYRIQSRDLRRRRGGALLNGYSSLYDLLREFLPRLDWDRIDKHRRIRVREVLAWVDAHHARHGKWPLVKSGAIPGTGETWNGINSCLCSGYRGLPGGMTLAQFLKKHRGVQVGRKPPHLSEKQILAWADAYFAAQGKWPTRESGPIAGTRETWCSVSVALKTGGRGLRRSCSLAQLLAKRRGVRNRLRPPPLKEKQILAWAQACFKATRRWPSASSGPVAQSSGDTWCAIDNALTNGKRGLRGRSSLATLLRKHGLK